MAPADPDPLGPIPTRDCDTKRGRAGKRLPRRGSRSAHLWARTEGKDALIFKTFSKDTIVQCPLGLATSSSATILGLATRNSGFWDDQYMNSTLGLATYIGFSDLNRVDENWSLNPAGTAFHSAFNQLNPSLPELEKCP